MAMATTTAPKGYKGLGMEGFLARWYTSMMRRAMDDYQALARRVAEKLPPGGSVIDVAPGPGFFAIELARLGDCHVTGLDISHTFVEIAQQNACAAGVDVDFRLGNASAMPFDDGSFDFVTCRAAFKNFSEPVRALQEMHRVLKPGGQALVIDLRRDASRETINTYVDKLGIGFANAMFMKLTFRFLLLKRAYTKSEFERMISQTKFGKVEIVDDLIGLEVGMGK